MQAFLRVSAILVAFGASLASGRVEDNLALA